jgi:O-succinylbenzoic acid--CoA ligase
MAAQPKSILVGGGPISGELLSASREAGARVFLTYGLTEMASQVSTTSDPSRLAGASDAGNVLPYRSVRIAGDGEILVRGETLFSGYLEGGSVQPATDADGWFHTRDVGWFTAEQHLVIRGRKDHMFVSGGENIHPEEIERAIERLPEVERAVVVDIPDEEYGARPVAFVSFRGRELRLDELRLRLDDLLPRFKHPVAVFPYPADEAGTLGKPARRSLREIARAKRRGHD